MRKSTPRPLAESERKRVKVLLENITKAIAAFEKYDADIAECELKMDDMRLIRAGLERLLKGEGE